MTSTEWSRRQFLLFLGRSAAVAAVAPVLAQAGCSPQRFTLRPLRPSREDDFLLADGFDYEVLIKWGEPLGASGENFGFNNDYIAFLPMEGPMDRARLWVNHEYINPYFVSGFHSGEKTREQVEMEMYEVGGSSLLIERVHGHWRLSKEQAAKTRLTGRSPIAMISDRTVAGSELTIGTLANCAGGVTPWGSVLTCEENYQDYYGDVRFVDGARELIPGWYAWHKHFSYPPEHYGWVVEVNVETLNAKKLIALGRFAHESATVRVAADGRCVVYSGDDASNECLYKFIADEVGSLHRGTLFVASLEQKRWLPLDIRSQDVLRENFTDQTEVMIRCREAAHLIGGTPLDRPEDVEIDPETGSVIVSLTYNLAKGNYYGSLLRLNEKNNDPLALEFEWDTFIAGGPDTGFACPDNLAFDPAGNLWMTSDISGPRIGTKEYETFGNNGLFFIPMSGTDAGRVIQIASGPVDSELTGPCFSPDGRTLFLSVQHPGELSRQAGRLTSHWPEGGDNIPRPAVVTISGPALDAIMKGRYETG